VADSTEIPAVCIGEDLELATLVDGAACRVTGDPQALPPTVVAVIEPHPVVVRRGASARASVVLRNTGRETAIVQLQFTCGADEQIDTTIHNGRGLRVDVTGSECGDLRGCGSEVVRFALRPGGAARMPFTVSTQTQRRDAQCQLHPAQPLRPGTYEVRAAVAFLPAVSSPDGSLHTSTLVGHLTVRP
jgi:hypothetical protein